MELHPCIAIILIVLLVVCLYNSIIIMDLFLDPTDVCRDLVAEPFATNPESEDVVLFTPLVLTNLDGSIQEQDKVINILRFYGVWMSDILVSNGVTAPVFRHRETTIVNLVDGPRKAAMAGKVIPIKLITWVDLRMPFVSEYDIAEYGNTNLIDEYERCRSIEDIIMLDYILIQYIRFGGPSQQERLKLCIRRIKLIHSHALVVDKESRNTRSLTNFLNNLASGIATVQTVSPSWKKADELRGGAGAAFGGLNRLHFSTAVLKQDVPGLIKTLLHELAHSLDMDQSNINDRKCGANKDHSSSWDLIKKWLFRMNNGATRESLVDTEGYFCVT